MSDKYLDQARQTTMVWRNILSTKEFESITVAKWQALDAEISRFARQAAADATRAERERNKRVVDILYQLTMRDQEIQGNCPYCGAADYPVDEDGKRIETDDVGDAEEWRLDHSPTCPFAIADAALAAIRAEPDAGER